MIHPITKSFVNVHIDLLELEVCRSCGQKFCGHLHRAKCAPVFSYHRGRRLSKMGEHGGDWNWSCLRHHCRLTLPYLHNTPLGLERLIIFNCLFFSYDFHF